MTAGAVENCDDDGGPPRGGQPQSWYRSAHPCSWQPFQDAEPAMTISRRTADTRRPLASARNPTRQVLRQPAPRTVVDAGVSFKSQRPQTRLKRVSMRGGQDRDAACPPAEPPGGRGVELVVGSDLDAGERRITGDRLTLRIASPSTRSRRTEHCEPSAAANGGRERRAPARGRIAGQRTPGRSYP